MKEDSVHRVVHRINTIELSAIHSGQEGQPAILLLHGFPSYSGTWAAYLSEFCTDHHCIAPDLRGFNRSSKPEKLEHYLIAHSVADVVGLIKKVSPDEPVALIGHDIGGYLAYALASAHPDLLRALIVINGAHPEALRRTLAADRDQAEASAYMDFLCDPKSEFLLSKNSFAGLKNICRTMVNGAQLPEAEERNLVDAWSQEGAVTAMLNWYRANRPALSAEPRDRQQWTPDIDTNLIRVPHLLIWGEQDSYLLAGCHRNLEPLCEDLEKVLIPDAGHTPHLTHPERVIPQIRRFLKRR